ncbi:MAG TPA: TetR/AcrR family transcriptional regulator [Rhizomicrobium sp.]|nr:TetR/AcrR family transcriptional regulator [Rhizomicrobium sp.]
MAVEARHTPNHVGRDQGEFSKMTKASPRKSAEEARTQEIIEAAVTCVSRLGARKVSVEDIATEAGISRRTLYRLYPNRRAIMRAAIFNRLEKIALQIQDAMRKCKTFEDCIVTGSVLTIKIAMRDEVYVSIENDDNTLVLDDPDYPEGTRVEPLFLSTWAGVFDRGRKEGKIHKSLTNHQLADWLMSVHLMIQWREDLSDTEKANLLRTFVLPSLKYAE